ncbi:MAG: DUF4870 domain-containing protein [Dokdonella sp.]|uniref:DUF4870 domain-containing protein n=2 Tax=Dokdonella sp. TaxID=2291710 RepID=UPI002C727382|nr:DUF4870 domain-containing protein [Dokdonella sp.]HOX71931.1 DUF4870 domain-containing protein [Dokdonella sp.]HPG95422.1 DUF4870 domain-containing protein [Dokdonella sp.]
MNVDVESQGSSDSLVAPTGDERTWALLGHLSALSAFVVTGIGCVLGPLIIWLVKRDSLPFAADQAKEALNFNITVLIAAAGLVLFSIVTVGIGLLLAVPLGFALFFYWLIFTIIAAVNANNGVRYRYPMTLRLVS